MLRFLSVATPVTSSGSAVLGGQCFCRGSADPEAWLCPREAKTTFWACPFPKRLSSPVKSLPCEGTAYPGARVCGWDVGLLHTSGCVGAVPV